MASSHSSSCEASPPDPGRPLFESTGGELARLPMELMAVRNHVDDAAATRRSSRAIKRKRFDDEIVDVTLPRLTSNSLPTPQTPSTPDMPQWPSSNPVSMSSLVPSITPSTSNTVNASPVQGAGANASYGQGGSRKTQLEMDPNSRSTLKRRVAQLSSCNKSHKKNKRREGPWKDLSRWKPTDDLALITNVQQTNDLGAVYRGVKFSCHFTLSEIQHRWSALLYEPVLSKMAVQALRNLPPEIVASVQSKALFSSEETDLISLTKASTAPTPGLDHFASLLRDNPTIFFYSRTPKDLLIYWHRLRQFNLLPDQSVQPLPRDNVLNFLDAESRLNDGEIFDDRDPTLDRELRIVDRTAKREIRQLEAEISHWQTMVDKVRGDSPPEFDNHTLAVLRGRLVRYLMRSREITLGRSTHDQVVDVDLKLEGPAWKVSRKQGLIRLRNTGEFVIANEGKRSIFVNGKPVIRGSKARLSDNSVVDIAGLKFVFLVNKEMIEAIRQEACKLILTQASQSGEKK